MRRFALTRALSLRLQTARAARLPQSAARQLRITPFSFSTRALSTTANDIVDIVRRGDMDELRRVVDESTTKEELRVKHDHETLLHIAAREGRTSIVQYLLSHGAAVNATNSRGETPLAVASQHRQVDVAMTLRLHGAKLTVSAVDVGEALCQAASQSDLATLEAFSVPGSNHSLDTKNHDGRTALHVAAATGSLEVTQWLVEHGANVNVEDRHGFTPWIEAKQGQHQDVMAFLESHGAKNLAESLGISTDGTLRLRPGSGATQDIMDAVAEILIDNGVYKRKTVHAEVDYFFNVLNFHAFYYQRFGPVEIASHLESYIAAKQLSLTGGALSIGIDTADHCFHLCEDNIAAMSAVETQLEQLIDENKKDGFSLTCLKSTGAAAKDGSSNLVMYILDKTDYLNRDQSLFNPADLPTVATRAFVAGRKREVYERYQEVVATASSKLSPAIKVCDPHWDKSIPVMFGFRRESLTPSLARVSDLFRTHHLSFDRKIIETFANDIIVYTIYFAADSDPQVVREFAENVSVLFLVPASPILQPLFMTGELTAKQYAYAVALKKFAYYFMGQDNDDFRFLLQHLKRDPHHISRVHSLQRLMRHETVTEENIAHVMLRYPELVQRLYADFAEIHLPNSGNKPGVNGDIAEEMEKAAVNKEDLIVLKAFLKFNASVLRTNFHKYPKSAISYRLDPNVLADLELELPFAIFFNMSNDFQGFHIRFDDIARGGIRAIKSDTKVVYARNKESLLMENYNLAHTQMRKNKDIPESGSKGTVLLAPGLTSPKSVEIAFRKYASCILDLLLPHEQIIDHFGQPEVLFLGPDENTADLMEWASNYSTRRGYAFGKAFTTGKPPSLGGIPHDVYGMTTRSVHKCVTELLKKMGEDESQVTKLQTGGPDGDLGSNEIFISCDKTVAIVDGSGVVYDPQGLNRGELERLAHERSMVCNPNSPFNTKLLSPEGFLVGQTEKNVQLPDGSVVDGRVLRDEFHLNPLSTADLFVPCGGRPESINIKNLDKVFMKDGKTPRFKYIVEGANLFITQEARLALEDAGVILFKDATANKGGVTSSSLEVLAALAMSPEEHSEHMCAESRETAPDFYKKYVVEVQNRVEHNAFLEFHCIWDESVRSGTSRILLSDIVSNTINATNNSIRRSDLYDQVALRERVLGDAVPGILLEQIGGLDVFLSRVPPAYSRAIFTAYLASNFVYQEGIHADHIAFYQFMEALVKGDK